MDLRQKWIETRTGLKSRITARIIPLIFIGFMALSVGGTLLPFLLGSFLSGQFFSPVLLPALMFGGVFALFITKLCSDIPIARRCLKYINIIEFADDNIDTISMNELAEKTGKDLRTVKTDLQWMKQQGLLTGIPLDLRKDIINLAVQSKRSKSANNISLDEVFAQESGKDPRIIQNDASTIFNFVEGDMQYEATRFVQHLAAQKDRCEDTVISEKISQLRTGVGKLLSYGYQNPQDCTQIRAFNRKYLCTSIKLIDKFIEMESLVNGSQTHTETHQKLVGGLDSLIKAYTLNLENMYNDDIVDINSDISVIENMLAQEGLLDNELTLDFNTTK